VKKRLEKVKVVEKHPDPGGESNPVVGQPRMFGGYIGSAELPWMWAAERLTLALNYWIATTRPDGKPHSRPVWGVWLDDSFYFSTGSLAAINLATNPAITVHLESGSEVVIIEGVAEIARDATLVEQIVALYNQKYNWNLDTQNMPDPFYAVRPQIAFGWHFEDSQLTPESSGLETATRWHFS